MKAMLLAVLIVPPLVAQEPPDTATAHQPVRRGWTLGVAGYTGGTWQPSGLDAGLVWKVGERPGRTVALTMRVGSFVQDQAVLIGRTRGFFSALLGQYRMPLAQMLELGTSESATGSVRLVALLESGVSLNFNSPLPQGNYHGIGAALLGMTAGGSDVIDDSFGIFLGATGLFGGGEATVHFTAMLRYQSGFGSQRPLRTTTN